MSKNKQIEYVDDDSEPTSVLLRLRAPSLFLGLLLGIVLSFITSRFEEVLAQNVAVAFFLPFIVYMADAVGTQTEAIYSRDLKNGKPKFHNYLVRESLLGGVFGLLFGALAGLVAWIWISSVELAFAVGFSMFLATAVAPLIALLVTQFLQLTHRDPAAGAGPIATVAQDVVCVVIYGIVASNLLL